MLKHCRPKEKLNCIYLTKENTNKFVNILKEYSDSYKYKNIELCQVYDEYLVIKRYIGNFNNDYTLETYYYNHWYVEEFDYYGEFIGWNPYSDENFDKYFEFINEE